jgi:hypothetical protein
MYFPTDAETPVYAPGTLSIASNPEDLFGSAEVKFTAAFLSVRLYSRVLDRKEIEYNAALDQIRYLTPPTVTIGGTACEDITVLSKHFLVCKSL